MENAIVTGIGVQRSTLPTLRAFRLRVESPRQGGFGSGVRVYGRTLPAPTPIFDPTQDVTPVRIT